MTLKMLAGGMLTAFSQSAGDGFDPNANELVQSAVVQPDGKVVIGGDFTNVGGTNCSRIARLANDGSVDPSFNAAIDGHVGALALQADGKIIVAGQFTLINGIARTNIGRLNPNGTLDAAFNPGTDGIVYNVALQSDGKILVGGAFTVLGGQPRYCLGRLNTNGVVDSTFNPAPNSTVVAVAVQPDGKILIGGLFGSVGGQAATNIARLKSDGTPDSSFSSSANSWVYTLAVQPDGKILAGGVFTTLGGFPHAYLGRLNANGSVDAAFTSAANSVVNNLTLESDGDILVSGYFNTLAGTPRQYIGRLKPDGSLDAGFDPNANNSVAATAVQADGKVILVGSFTTLGGRVRNRIARLEAAGELDANFELEVDAPIGSIAVQADGSILLAGGFTSVAGQPRTSSARLHPDGTLDTIFNPVVSGAVWCYAVQKDGKIVVGGAIDALNGHPRSNLGRLNADGSLDATFNAQADGSVFCLMIQSDGKILVCGFFDTLNGQSRHNIGRLNPDGSLDVTFESDANRSVWTMALQPDGKILVGGFFTTLNWQPRNHIGRLHADGTLDTTFDPGQEPQGGLSTIAVQPDGKILLGGYLTAVAGHASTNLARLNADGTADTSFLASVGDQYSWVNSILVQPDGRIVIGGGFTSVNGFACTNLGRLNSNGTLDTSFLPNVPGNSFIFALGAQADGKVLVGGSFESLGGQSRTNVARLTPAYAALQSLDIDPTGSVVTWLRSGGGPEVSQVRFDFSLDGVSYSDLGTGTRRNGGWEFKNLTLPIGQAFYVRARAHTPGSYFASSGLAESVRQFFLNCSPTISPSNGVFAAAAGAVPVQVSNNAGCAWTVAPPCSFIGVSPTNATGSGTVIVSVSANPTATARTCTFSLAGKNFTVQQAGCAVTPSVSVLNFPASGGAAPVTLTSSGGCSWSVEGLCPFVTAVPANGSGTANISVSVTANPTSGTRSCALTIGTNTVQVIQSGCSFAIAPRHVSFAAAGGTASVALTTSNNCSWATSSPCPFVMVTPPNGVGPGTVTVTVAPNATLSSRDCVLTIANQTFTLTQGGAADLVLTVSPTNYLRIVAPTNTLNLKANITGGTPVSFLWSKIDGVDQVTFTDPTSRNTTAIFQYAGTYVLSVTASDGTHIGRADVCVSVESNPSGVFQNVANFVRGELTNIFLTRYLSTPADAANYYAAIDPGNLKTTFMDWKIANGFPTNPIPPAATNFMGGVVSATYINTLDLGFGRGMIMTSSNGNWAYSVSNYRNVDDAINDRDVIAAVTMDYSPVVPGGTPFTKFYVYGGNGNRVPSADLDGGGEKYVPGLCVVCHGGTTGTVLPGSDGNVYAHFLPFDLREALDYSSNSNFTRAAQEPAFKILNQGVREIESSIAQHDLGYNGYDAQALLDLMDGWYGSGFTNAAQKDDYVPIGWQDENYTNILSLSGQAYLYLNVVAPSCRSCHLLRSHSRDFLDFAQFHDFAVKGLTQCDTFGCTTDLSQPHVNLDPATPIQVPHARRTFERFWASVAPRPQPEILRDYLLGRLTNSTSAPIITGVAQAGSDLRIRFNTVLDSGYAFERRAEVEPSAWTPLPGAISGTGGPIELFVPAREQKAFYRIVVVGP